MNNLFLLITRNELWKNRAPELNLNYAGIEPTTFSIPVCCCFISLKLLEPYKARVSKVKGALQKYGGSLLYFIYLCHYIYCVLNAIWIIN